jgi:hypothetical protein
VGLCSVLAATYLTVEAQSAGDQGLVAVFQARAVVAGAVTAGIGAVAALLAHFDSPVLWQGLVGRALPLSLGAILIGLGTAAALLLGYYRVARLGVAAETACILAAWGVAQYPYLIIPDVTLSNAAVPRSVLMAVVIASLAGMVVLLPSLWYLFHIFKGRGPAVSGPTAAERADQGLRLAFPDAAASSGHDARSVKATGQSIATGGTKAGCAREGRLALGGLTALAALVVSLLAPVVRDRWLVRQVRRRRRNQHSTPHA